MTHVLVPIFVCVVLPVSIVLIYFLSVMNSDNKRSQVLIKAIESDNCPDADKLAESLRKTKRSARELLNLRLLRGCIFSLIGLALIILGLVNYHSGHYEFGSDPVTVPLMFGSVSAAVGISYLIVYFVSRKQVDDKENKD